MTPVTTLKASAEGGGASVPAVIQQRGRSQCHTCFLPQDYARVIGEEFVTSLASIAERLLHQLDASITSTPGDL